MANWAAIAQAAAPYVGMAGQIAAQRSAAKAGARQDEAAANLAQDRYNQNNYAAQQNATLTAGSMAEAARLKRAQLALDTPEQRTRQALWADILNNVQDAKIEGLGAHIPKVNVSGGLRPSLIGAGGKQAAQMLQTQALNAMMTGSDIPKETDFSKLILTPPSATPLPEAGAEDKWLNILASLGQVAQGVDTVNRMRPRSATATAPSDPQVAQDFGGNAMRGVRF
ncbi:MAG TPA: hypothetical protein VFY71_07430 [Planctomycetota bacterium]|nr:hypothetical protein [Planctomycetota bacterium]